MNNPGKNILYYVVAALGCLFALLLSVRNNIGGAALIIVMTFGIRYVFRNDDCRVYGKTQALSLVLIIMSNFICEAFTIWNIMNVELRVIFDNACRISASGVLYAILTLVLFVFMLTNVSKLILSFRHKSD